MQRLLGSIVPFLGALFFACLCGYLLGRIVTVKLSIPALPTVIRDAQEPLVPTVRLDGVVNGEARGTIVGGARFFLGQHPVVTDQSGAFRVPATPILTAIISVTVPEGMRFVASKRGQKYYPVDSAGAAGLAPVNRIYFRTAEEAEEAGYAR